MEDEPMTTRWSRDEGVDDPVDNRDEFRDLSRKELMGPCSPNVGNVIHELEDSIQSRPLIGEILDQLWTPGMESQFLGLGSEFSEERLDLSLPLDDSRQSG